MKFYLSAKYSYREALLPIAETLKSIGHEVQARWLYRDEPEASSVEQKRKAAHEDLCDIEACHKFVMFNFPIGQPEPSSGRHVEFGCALMLRKPCILVGPNESVFATLAGMQFATVEDFLHSYTNLYSINVGRRPKRLTARQKGTR